MHTKQALYQLNFALGPPEGIVLNDIALIGLESLMKVGCTQSVENAREEGGLSSELKQDSLLSLHHIVFPTDRFRLAARQEGKSQFL